VGSDRVVVRLGCVAVLTLAGCYESPPIIPEGYGPRTVEGWPSPTVYAREAAHPVNRWFHRSFARRSADGRIVAVRPDAPLSEMRVPGLVDRAEIAALLAAVDRELATVDAAPATRALLRADLLAQARFWSGHGSEELARRHRELAGRVQGATDDWPSALQPPPLRQGRWQRVVAEGGDARRTVLYDVTASDGARVGPVGDSSAPERAALLFSETGVPMECWTIDVDDGSVRYAIYRLDRAAQLEGGDAWRRLPLDTTISIRGLGRREGEMIEGVIAETCASCHSARAPIMTHGRKHVYGAIRIP